MSVTYFVVFEKYGDEFRIAGVADSRDIASKISGSISSKGPDYTALYIPYDCNTPLNEELFVVYTRKAPVDEETSYTFFPMVYGSQYYPTTDDIYLYKTEKSAIERVSKLNTMILDESKDIVDKEAVVEKINLNYIYNIEEVLDDDEELVEDTFDDDFDPKEEAEE